MEPWQFLRHFRSHLEWNQNPEAQQRHQQLTSRASVCSYCGVGCPYGVETDGKGRDKVVPLSSLGLCIKGKTSLLTGGLKERTERLKKRHLPDDRIRFPMMRGHDGQMHEVTWEQALDRAAWLFLHAREWVGPDAVAVYGNGQKTLESIWIASLYKLVFRLPTIGANSEHCLASAGAAHELNFGNEASFTAQEFEELESCDVAVLHGTNPYITFPQAYEKLKRNEHAIKVVIDPVETDTVTDLRAHDSRTLHIRFRQGCDILFNLAVSRVILENKWENRSFLDQAVSPESEATFRELCFEDRFDSQFVAQQIAPEGCSPEETEQQIRDYAALIALPSEHSRGERPRVAIVSSMGINQSTGAFGFSTNLNQLLLTGNVGRPGAGSLRIAGQSNATSELMMGFNSRRLVFNFDPEKDEHREALAKVLEIPVDNIPAKKGTPVARMCEDDQLYCFLFVGTQMTKNMPRLGHWMRRMGRAFNVVIDPFLADGVLEWADVLLPATTYTERTGVIQRGDRTLQLQQQLTSPPEKAWSDEQILVRLALAIAKRLRDPDTAQLNGLSAEVVERTFGRYADEQGEVDASRIFDHVVEVSNELDLYSKLVDEDGVPISHAMLRDRAGMGIQWQGNGRYSQASEKGHVFPGLKRKDKGAASLVCPPEELIQPTHPVAFEKTEPGPSPKRRRVRLISGRGRPGKNAMSYRGRFNSGIKTLPIYGVDANDYFAEIHPTLAKSLGLADEQAVRLSSDHGGAIACVAINDRIPEDAIFMDFVPGEINRLTNFLEADQFTNQSFIKRTKVSIQPLSSGEARLWDRPCAETFSDSIGVIHADYRRRFPTDEDWVKTQQGDPPDNPWPTRETLNQPSIPEEFQVAQAVGAFITFLQRHVTDTDYQNAGAEMLRGLSTDTRQRFLTILLPILRRLDYQSALHQILSDLTGDVVLGNADGTETRVNLLSAHKSAILEFKEEIVAIQLFLAIKRGIEHLFGAGERVERDRLAFVSGIAIPCAGDVPAHFADISPADLNSDRLIHSRAIGSNAVMVIDRQENRAVRVDVKTGILPRDSELTLLRSSVINRKRAASTQQHNRFFDRLGELIVQYVSEADNNFDLFGPGPIDWSEYVEKLHTAPAGHKSFREHLVKQGVTPELAQSLGELGIWAVRQDKDLSERLRLRQENPEQEQALEPEAATLSGRVGQVVQTVIEPVLSNDGGRLEVLEINEASGEVVVRFVGSCANCPYSLLSMENIVKPSLMGVRGVQQVTHRSRVRESEKAV